MLKIVFAKFAIAGLGLAAAMLAGDSGLSPAIGQSRSLEGTWSGGGRIVFPSGETERARCRASFRRQGGNSYGMSAVCATPSARVEQSAAVTHVTGNRYRGEFINQEFGISGSIRITVSGDSLSASLSGGGGSAEFALSR
ncbi:MAG: hypothetical protein AB7F78_05975 [Hyphomicrobiaceae bacterium]